MDVVIEGGVPAIVSKELFYQVQQRTLATRKAPQRGRAKKEYILTGKIICGLCGDKMTGSTSTGRGGQYSYLIALHKEEIIFVRKNQLEKTL